MADVPKTAERPLQRACECHRLEDQLLDLAYREAWPQVRKPVQKPLLANGDPKKNGEHERSSAPPQAARRA